MLTEVGFVGHVSRRNAWVMGIISFLAALFTCGAGVISTVLYTTFRSVFESAPEFNIVATLGAKMYAFVWLAAGFSVLAFGLNVVGCCVGREGCCGRRRKKRIEGDGEMGR